MNKKLDDFFMFLAKAIAVIMVICFLYALGVFDAILGKQEFYIDYHNKRENTFKTK